MNGDNAWQAVRYVLDDPTLDRALFEDRMLSDIDLALAVADAVSQVDAVTRAAAGPAVPDSSAAGPADQYLSLTGGPNAWHWSSVAALAAGLLIVIGLGIGQLNSFPGRATTGSLSANARTHSDRLAVPGEAQDVFSFSGDRLNDLDRDARGYEGAFGPERVTGADGHSLAFQHVVAEQWLAMRRDVPTNDALEGIDGLYGSDEARDGLPGTSSGEGESNQDDDWMLEAAREFFQQGVAS